MITEQSKRNQILLVEDDPATAEMITFYLNQDNLKVELVADGHIGFEKFKTSQPDLCILDIMLPGQDGIQLCRQIREVSNVPILMLSARVTDVDKAVALSLGADDYLTKPFSPTELISRIRAMLRRAYQLNSTAAVKEVIEERLGGPRLQLDPHRHQVFLDGVLCAGLTPVEFSILEVLMRSPGWVCTRAQFLQKVWPSGEEAVEETVTVHINNLRHKLGIAPNELIQTVRGVGYTYREH